ncbi:hypothetical protein C1645_833860 [Glomus cerebriforme]|uniref:Uncharacterized protein n=1 Tax=Glomus cerebriforme TaxID=658196 RepID=A0A397SHI3_9GLOM|nr:hypothetical protein C1645_833860 [Glomus cerebriforme]
MAFQAQLPFEIICELLDFKKINNELIYRIDFDAEIVKHIVLTRIDYGCLGPFYNIVILELDANPNSDEEILHVAKAYKEDFELENHSYLNIVANEAIFCRLIKYWHVYFGFDEILETFGIRFIKQNISGNVINKTNLNNQIKAFQNERKRIDLLMSEYLNDHSVSHGEQAVNLYKESL